MSIRDDLAGLLRRGSLPPDTIGGQHEVAVAYQQADAVLAWLGPWLNEFRDEYAAGRAPAQHVWSIDAAIEQVRQAREESS